MRFTAAVLSFAALAAAQETIWVIETVIGTNCAPTGYPTIAPTYVPSNRTTTSSPSYSSPVYVPPAGNATVTPTGGPAVYPTATPSESLGAGSGAGSILPASGLALAGVVAAIMAVVA
ncbi:hypothetical protein ABW20_dc0106037 [Dactylellina cionopaga]|nr:hypothetical protein ABW20_dc0106037 [Dactylellina cionopaga]